jgi:fatty acid desaturase
VEPGSNHARILYPLLPAAAFQRRPSRVAYGAIHVVVFVAMGVLVREVPGLGWRLLASLVAGHSLMCLALFAHELSHGAILSPGPLRSLLELICWGPNLIAPTAWHSVHNRTHHRYANTAGDPDRRFLTAEATVGTRLYTSVFYPQGGRSWPNPLILFHFIPYVVKQTLGVLFPGSGPAFLIPARSTTSARERWRTGAELAFIAGLQWLVFLLSGGRWSGYLFMGPLALSWASGILMAYVVTNHYANAVHEHADPLATTTSVIVPRLADWLHLRFSFHTEHHLFPSMDSRHFPSLSRLLLERYPAEYHRVSFREAWRQAWRAPAFVEISAAPDQAAAAPSKQGAL